MPFRTQGLTAIVIFLATGSLSGIRAQQPLAHSVKGAGSGSTAPLTPEPYTLRVPTSYHTVAFSPDARLLTTGGPGGTVKTWDVATGQERTTFSRHKSEVFDVAFSPDGRWLASAGRDGAKLWNVATGRTVFTTWGQPWVDRVAFSPDAQFLASAGSRGIKVWQVATGAEVRAFGDVSSWVSTVAYSPDGSRLACGNMAKTIKVWDPRTGQQIHTLLGHGGAIYTVVFSPDGKRLASASADMTVRLWDMATGREVLTLRGHGRPVFTVAFSPDGKRLVSAGGDGTVRLWDAATGRPQVTLQAHSGLAYCAVFSPDGCQLASTGNDGKVRVWRLGGPNRASLAPPSLEALWADLGGADAARAFRASFALAAAPGDAVPFLKKHLRPAPVSAATTERLARLIADLDANRYVLRRKATQELRRLGKLGEPGLRHVLQDSSSPEVRLRVERLLVQLERLAPSAEQLLAQRATAVLERIGTSEARALLQTLAQGPRSDWLTAEAQAALERLARRPPPRPILRASRSSPSP